MAARRVEIHPEALAELTSALAWYQERSQTAAENFVAELDRAIGLVTSSPGQWPTADHSTRRFILQRFPFAIIYRELRGSIQVLAVAHGHRRPGYWKERL